MLYADEHSRWDALVNKNAVRGVGVLDIVTCIPRGVLRHMDSRKPFDESSVVEQFLMGVETLLTGRMDVQLQGAAKDNGMFRKYRAPQAG